MHLSISLDPFLFLVVTLRMRKLNWCDDLLDGT